jgi:hypothetical protein
MVYERRLNIAGCGKKVNTRLKSITWPVRGSSPLPKRL